MNVCDLMIEIVVLIPVIVGYTSVVKTILIYI